MNELLEWLKEPTVYPRPDCTKEDLMAFTKIQCNKMEELRLALLTFLLEKR